MSIKNIVVNFFKKKYFLVLLFKLFKRLEKNTSKESKNWARKNCLITTEQYCKNIDDKLWLEAKEECNKISLESKQKIAQYPFSLGGGGNYVLLYFLVRKYKPRNIIETGVAAGWSSLAILRALNKNNFGKLYSSDFPYFRIKNSEEFIGVLAKNEKNLENWTLDITGDQNALTKFSQKIEDNSVDLFHYDSDKSYSGRSFAIKTLWKKFSKKCIIIFDDIQDNLYFKNFVKKNNLKFTVINFENKFIGIINYN